MQQLTLLAAANFFVYHIIKNHFVNQNKKDLS